MALHQELRARKLRTSVANEKSAQEAARRRFGNTGLMAEASRSYWGWAWLEVLGQDLRYALRTLRGAPLLQQWRYSRWRSASGLTRPFFVRTVGKLRSADLGFRPERILLFDIDPPRTRYSGQKRTALFEQLENEISAIPGIQSVSLSANALVANSSSTTRVAPEGRDTRPEDADRAWINEVGHRFFETMGIPILYGRGLSVSDGPNAPTVAVVNREFARHFFPGEIPLGKRFGRQKFQIVGISGDAHFNTIRGEIPSTFYVHYRQMPDSGRMTFELKTGASQASVVSAVRRVVQAVDRDLPVMDIRTQTQQIEDTISRERVFAGLATCFGALALTLACIGIYGIMANSVSRRTGEIGIRMALGAQTRQVLRMVLGETLLLVLIGAAVGIGAAAALTRYVRTLLYGLEPSDPVTFGGTIALMMFAALLAGGLPAKMASSVDPMTSLRHE